MLQSFTLRQQLQTARQGNCYFILLYFETMDGKYGEKGGICEWSDYCGLSFLRMSLA